MCFLFLAAFFKGFHTIVPLKNLLCELNFITEACYGFQNLMWNLCGEHLMISLNETYLEWHYRFNMWKFWPISQCILFDRKNLPVDGIHSWNFHQRIKFYQMIHREKEDQCDVGFCSFPCSGYLDNNSSTSACASGQILCTS